MSRLATFLALLCLASSFAFAQTAAPKFEGRLQKIQATNTITIAYRTDALPFFFEDEDKRPAGYMVDLCRRIVGAVEREIRVVTLQVKWVPVTAQNRFDAVRTGAADLECGASTLTL